jgi:hypothetical protein
MAIEPLLKSMRRRVPWEVAHKLLSELELPTGVGWDRTVGKIQALTDLTDQDETEISAALRDHIICGEKSVRLYPLQEAAKERLLEALRAHPHVDSPFRAAYPCLASDESLGDVTAAKPELLAVEEDEEGTAAIFTSVRTLELRESLEIDSLPEPAAAVLSGYDDIVGVKLIRWQAMDIVWIPRDGSLVDLRVDFPRGMRQEAGDVAHRMLIESVMRIVGSDLLGDPANLFNLIDRIYQDSTEGRVIELAFGTTTASLKHEKMRRKHLNLRSEAYHVSGKAGLGTPIEPFRLAVEWDIRAGRDIVARPEAQFFGSVRLTVSTNPTLPEVVVRKCRGRADFAFVRSRIAFHLGAT